MTLAGTGSDDDADVRELFGRLPDEKARERLVEEFLPLAEHLARRFYGRGEPIDDLLQVANLGLLHAIDRFDPDREVRFSTFAAVTVVGELKRHFRDRGWSVRVPRQLQESALLVNRVLGELWQEFGRSPSVREVAARSELTEDQVLEAMDALHAYSTTSLDAPIGEDGGSSAETLGDPDEAYEISEGWVSITPSVRRLPARERRILYLRFFKGMTQSEIAREVGISQMHVSRLLSQTLERLREEARTEPEGDTHLPG
jgi:RNA polymerase sigma-B factor